MATHVLDTGALYRLAAGGFLAPGSTFLADIRAAGDNVAIPTTVAGEVAKGAAAGLPSAQDANTWIANNFPVATQIDTPIFVAGDKNAGEASIIDTIQTGNPLAPNPVRVAAAVDALRNALVDTPASAAVEVRGDVAVEPPADAAIEPPADVAPDATPDAPAWAARKLLRAARSGTLATSLAGQPFASLVTPATAPDLSLLLLLSSLSEHTRHLRAEPRCSVLVVGTATDANPQTAPRATITGLAETIDDPELKARFLAVHPYASLYADFGDFALWRIRPMGGLYVGGFARAARLRRADLTPEPDAVAAIAAAAAGIMAHCNADHPDAMARIAGAPGAWRMVGVDVDGCDLAQGEQVIRVSWSAPVADPGGVRAELVRLARAAG